MNQNTLLKISYGMYVICSKSEGRFNGQIATTVMQVTAEPAKVSVCISKETLTHQYISSSRIFTASILEQDTPMTFVGHFGFKSGRDFDKLEGVVHKTGVTGAPAVIQNCLGYVECEVEGSLDAGTHTIFFGKVLDAQDIKEGEPLTYAYYHSVKRGKSQKNAPTYYG